MLADLLFVIAFTGLLFGIATVYAHLSGSHVERQAFVGLVLTVTGIALFQTLNGVGAFAFPAAARLYLQGQQDALDVVAAILRGPLIPVAAAGIVLIALGAVVLGIAIWRSGTLPKWAGLTYAAAFVLLLLAPQPATLIRALQGVLAGAAGLALAWSIWKQAPNGPAR